jgi:uncharacterized protein YutE (UPF0331/DUF86 family)
MDDIVVNKAAIIERCIRRIGEEFGGDDSNLTANLTKQDSIILNLQRTCEAAIDLAMHLVRVHKLGVPQDSREGFDLLRDAGFIDVELATRLRAMVGFRNLAVHDYRALDLVIVRSIITNRLGDFLRFSELAVRSDGFRR